MKSMELKKVRRSKEQMGAQNSFPKVTKHDIPGHPIAQLQRRFGNRNVAQLIQTKLAVGEPGDRYEQEAEGISKKVVEQMGIVSSPLQQIARGGHKIQTFNKKASASNKSVKKAPSKLESNIQSQKRGGRELSGDVRWPMEHAFGADFSDVRVHTNVVSASLNTSLQSRAFTVGRDIFFNKNEYQPETREGKKLLAHELTHVLQQSGTNGTQQTNADGGMVQRAIGPHGHEQIIVDLAGQRYHAESKGDSEYWLTPIDNPFEDPFVVRADAPGYFLEGHLANVPFNQPVIDPTNPFSSDQNLDFDDNQSDPFEFAFSDNFVEEEKISIPNTAVNVESHEPKGPKKSNKKNKVKKKKKKKKLKSSKSEKKETKKIKREVEPEGTEVPIDSYNNVATQGPLYTKGLGDCVAILGYNSQTGRACMYHVELTGQAYDNNNIAIESEWLETAKKKVSQFQKIYKTRKSTIEGVIGNTNVSYQAVLGMSWKDAKDFDWPRVGKWQQLMTNMLNNLFGGLTFRGYGKIAIWDPNSGNLRGLEKLPKR